MILQALETTLQLPQWQEDMAYKVEVPEIEYR